MMKIMNDHIKQIIEHVVRERLSSETVRIMDVKIVEDADSADENVYSVMVTYEAPYGVLDPDKTLGLVRHTRSKLAASSESAFPIFRFVSQSDAKKIGIAAA